MKNSKNFEIDLTWIILLGLVFIFGTGRGIPQDVEPIIIP